MSGVSNHFDALTAIQGVINGLALVGAPTVVVQEVANYQDQQVTLPMISVSPYGPEKLEDELNDRDGVYYGILVAIIAKPDATSLEQRLGWRQTMRRNLHNHNIGSLNMNYNLRVEPGNVIEPRAWFDRVAFVSGFIVRAYFQEPRV